MLRKLFVVVVAGTLVFAAAGCQTGPSEGRKAEEEQARQAESLSDLLGLAGDVARAAGGEKVAKRIDLAQKPFQAKALENPDTREAKAVAIGQTLSLKAIATMGPVIKDDALQEYVNLVAQAVALQTPRYNQRFYVGVLWNEETTGISLPHGYIYVTSGLLEALKDEAELAAVLAHEIEHIVAEDGLNMYQRQLQQGFWRGVAMEAGDEGEEFVRKYGQFFNEFFINGYSREQEIQADRMAVHYLYETGYRPTGLIQFLERAKANPNLKHEAGKQHPTNTQRIQIMQRELQGLSGWQDYPTNAERYRLRALEPLKRLGSRYREIKQQREAEIQRRIEERRRQEEARRQEEQRRREEKRRKAEERRKKQAETKETK